jgi:thiol-disulfide isomerase/thioredoxin
MRETYGASLHQGALAGAWVSQSMHLTVQVVKYLIALFSAVILMCLPGSAQSDNTPSANDVPPVLTIGSPAPDFNLPGIDGNLHSLREYASAKVLIVVFTCNHCPIAEMYEKRIEQLTADYKDRGVSLVAIMGNDPNAISLDELNHSDLGDSLPEMKVRAAYRHFNFPYLYDGDTQTAARKFGPIATPHVFIFDQLRRLRYQGRIDNNPREELVTKHEVRDAVDDLLSGRPVHIENTPVVGCSTKWAYKEEERRAEVAETDQKPTTLDFVSADQLKALRRNDGTGKILLLNFWATWCGPCTAEFPEIEKMAHMYAKRPLSIVTVSINAPDEDHLVMAFLKKQHATNRNVIWSTNDSADAVAAFGSPWNGAVPYTILIGMNGEVLFKSQGAINAVEVRRAILRNLPDDDHIGQRAYWNSTF